MEATLTFCRTCGAIRAAVSLTPAKTIAGTGDSMCGHLVNDTAEVFVAGIVHVALSTIIRDQHVDMSARDTAHTIQEWMDVPDWARNASMYPMLLIQGYGVSSAGLATARILARTMSALSAPSDAFYWKAAANVMRRRLS